MITKVDHDHSTVTLNIPNQQHIFAMFHMSQIIPFGENDTILFPSRNLDKPSPVVLEGEEEYFINRILDKQKHGHGKQYLVCWTGYGPEDDQWLPASELMDCEALDIWLARQESM
jgi:hypothetical protein